jgi:hypothetical protein
MAPNGMNKKLWCAKIANRRCGGRGSGLTKKLMKKRKRKKKKRANAGTGLEV